MDAHGSPPRARVDPAEMIAMIQARAEGVVLPGWPVFDLVAAGGRGWLCGVGERNDTIRALRVDYRRPGLPDRLIVQTQPACTVSPIWTWFSSRLGRPRMRVSRWSCRDTQGVPTDDHRRRL